MDDDDWDNDRPLEAWENPDEDDASEQATTTVCPNCRAEMYDDTEQCPHCGEYITRLQFLVPAFAWWVYVGAIAALVGMVASLWFIC